MEHELSAEGVRQVMLRGFIDLQYEKMHETAKRLGSPHKRADINRFIEFQVKEAFDRAKALPENPTKSSLLEVVDILVRKAAAMGLDHAEIAAFRKRALSALDKF